MLNKNADAVLVGKSLYSLILGIELLRQGKKVLLIDDTRFEYGEQLNDCICHLEKTMLQTWGKKIGIEPLSNIDEYLSTHLVYFVSNRKRLFLGSEPWDNLGEITRKLTGTDSESDRGLLQFYLNHIKNDPQGEIFNKKYYEYCQILANKLFDVDIENLKSDTFSQIDETIDVLFNAFYKTLFSTGQTISEKYKDTYVFTYMAEGYFHKKFGIKDSIKNLFHLMICCLSPQYKINSTVAIDHLLRCFCDMGGEFKKTIVKEWFYDRGTPWSLELDSFDGIIHPGRLYFFGEVGINLPIEIFPIYKKYHAIRVNRIPAADSYKMYRNTIIYSSFENIGTDIPLIKVNFRPDMATFDIFIERTSGDKVDFYRDKVAKNIESVTNMVTNDKAGQIFRDSMNFTNDICIKNEYGEDDNAKDYFGNLIEVFDRSIPFKGKKLINVRYFGPLVRKPQGLLSILMDIKDELYKKA